MRWEAVPNGMVEGRNENLYVSLDGLSGIYLHGWNPRVCLVDGISHLCQASPADVLCNPVHHIESHVLRRIARDSQPRWPTISLILLVLCQQLHTYLAARLCTISPFFMLSEVCGLQTVAAYSRSGRTND